MSARCLTGVQADLQAIGGEDTAPSVHSQANAGDKIVLSEEILKDEAENYSFGKVTLNDYIDAVNRVDENKFNRILHTVNLKKLLVEWLRLTDRLVVKELDELAG